MKLKFGVVAPCGTQAHMPGSLLPGPPGIPEPEPDPPEPPVLPPSLPPSQLLIVTFPFFTCTLSLNSSTVMEPALVHFLSHLPEDPLVLQPSDPTFSFQEHLQFFFPILTAAVGRVTMALTRSSPWDWDHGFTLTNF